MAINFLLFVGAIQAFFLAFVFLFKERKKLADWVLITWLFVISIHLVFVYFGFAGVYRKFPMLLIFGSSLMFLQGPLLFIYTALATNYIQKIKAIQWLHIIPFLFFTLYIAWSVINSAQSDKFQFLTTFFSDTDNIIVQLFGILNHLHLIIYLILSITLVRNHKKNIPNSYSYSEGVNLNWLRNLIVGIAAIAVLILIGLLFSDVFPIISHRFKASLIYSAYAILPFYMSFYTIRQKIVYPVDYQNVKTRAYKSGLSSEDSVNIAKSLSEFMVSDKPYLNPKLSIKELADGMKIHPKILSQVINENFNQNFFNYVNEYRVEEFKLKMQSQEYSHFTLLAIAFDCGFSTKSSFYSIFRKITGKTPSAFKLSLDN